MKTQPKHTQGEWRQVGNYILSENNEEVAKIITSDVTNELTAEANAQRIVKAANSYDDSIDIAKHIMMTYGSQVHYPEGTLGARMREKATKLLKQAEQK